MGGFPAKLEIMGFRRSSEIVGFRQSSEIVDFRCCFIEETEFVIGLEEVSHGLTVVGSKGAMELSKRKGKAVCVAKGKETVAHQVANTSIGTPTTATSRLYSVIWHCQHCFRLFTICCLSFDSIQRCGFGRQPNAKNKKDKKAHKVTTSRAEQDAVLEARKTSTRQPGTINRAPGLSFQSDGKSSNIAMDLEFEEH